VCANIGFWLGVLVEVIFATVRKIHAADLESFEILRDARISDLMKLTGRHAASQPAGFDRKRQLG
jgi:hypothetical protein